MRTPTPLRAPHLSASLLAPPPPSALTASLIARERAFSARNYAPLPIVLTRGLGVHVWDVDGRRLLDMMSAYSSVSHGHSHPRLVAALAAQAGRLSVTSRAFYGDVLGAFLERACGDLGGEVALPMNSGTEAVETGIKAARKWAEKVKGVPEGMAEIVACERNFHGESIAIVGMSSDAQYRRGFGPFTGGVRLARYGDAKAVEEQVTENTAAVLVEPIQGEGGVIVPKDGFLKEVAEMCKRRNVLLIVDEVQSGMCRTGKMLACWHDGVRPDGIIVGKALGGGLLPVSMFLGRKDVMDVFTPGDHGSTFGGNSLAAAVGLEALKVMDEDNYALRSATLGAHFLSELRMIETRFVTDVRGRGLFVGIEVDPGLATAREVVLRLMARGLLTKETHETVVRLAPPLVITQEQLDWAVNQIRAVLEEMEVDLLRDNGERRKIV